MQRPLIKYLFYILAIFYCSTINAKSTEFIFNESKESYRYSVVPTGENFTFKFAKSPEDRIVKIKAGRHVLISVYEDASIQKNYTESYIKERARCFVFDSHFYTYSLCFLPNDFDTSNKDRFWGFVTQVPNWKWLITRFFLPVVLTFAFFLYIGRRQKL